MARTHAVYLWGASAGLGLAGIIAFASDSYVLSLTYFTGQIALMVLGIIENEYYG